MAISAEQMQLAKIIAYLFSWSNHAQGLRIKTHEFSMM